MISLKTIMIRLFAKYGIICLTGNTTLTSVKEANMNYLLEILTETAVKIYFAMLHIPVIWQ